MNITLTVCFEDPYWVGIFERFDGELYSVSKFTFGSEPSTPEVYSLITNCYYKLSFTGVIPVDVQAQAQKKVNPKRQKREIHRLMSRSGVSTKAQEAMKLEFEQKKVERKALSREQKEQAKEQKFQLRMEKKKEKKKGH